MEFYVYPFEITWISFFFFMHYYQSSKVGENFFLDDWRKEKELMMICSRSQQRKIGYWLFFQEQHFISIYLQYLTTSNLLEIDFIILKIVTRIESSFPLDFLKIRRNPKWRCVYFSKWFFKERTIRKELVGDVKTRTHASFSEVLQ